MSQLSDPGYRLHCWHGERHAHASESEAKRCILLYQPGSQAAWAEGCQCRRGHIFGGCVLHSPHAAAYRRQTA